MINFLDTMSDFEKQLDRLKAEIAHRSIYEVWRKYDKTKD